jgi:hypothetical protein
MKKLIFIGLPLLGLALGAFFFFSRTRPSDEEQIFSDIDELKVAVEQKNSQNIMSNISEQYQDSAQLSHRGLQLMALQLARTRGKITVNITDYSEPRITGKKAKLSLAAEVIYGDGDEIVSSKGKVDFYLAKEKRKWKIIRAEGWQNWAQQAGLGYEW